MDIATSNSSGSEITLSAIQLIRRSRQGLAGSDTSRIAGQLGVSDKEMARLLNLSESTYYRRAKAGRLDAATSERLLLLARLATYGAEVFQDKDKFNRWLRRPLRVLANESPLDLLDSPTGVQLIEDILGRIEYGVFS